MIGSKADVVICGAGIAGIAAAYQLTVKQDIQNVLLVDERPPLTLTSDKSSEGYRNWWPGPDDAMVRFMNRSLDLLEELALESDNFFHLNRRGYVYLTAVPDNAKTMEKTAVAISQLGAGELRFHKGVENMDYRRAPSSGFSGQPDGADLILDPALIQQAYPFITKDAVALLHARRCGWLSAQQLGMYLLDQAKTHGARLITGRLTGVKVENDRVRSVSISQGIESLVIQTSHFVNAAGPLVKEVGQLFGVDLPVFNELHSKIAVEDTLGIIPRHAPLMIWNDPITLPWSDEERDFLAEEETTRWLLTEFPAGLHFRPEGGPGSQTVILLWPYHLQIEEPHWPHRFDPEYPEVVLRGLTRMIPGMAPYLERMGKPIVDGGYYCKTWDNRPLIGPLPVAGTYVIGALSGYGIMAAMAAGELLSAHIAETTLPDYAPAFSLTRYDDLDYQQLLVNWGDANAGQL